MGTAGKHYKFINSKTGYAIFYHSLKGNISEDKCKEELEKVKAQVAIKNTIPVNTVYWEEIKEEVE
jgi:hypothetical protein